jgi:hypothetical protein
MSTQSVDINGVADYLDATVATIKRRMRAGNFPLPDAVENGVEWWEITTLDRYRRSLKRKAAKPKKNS